MNIKSIIKGIGIPSIKLPSLNMKYVLTAIPVVLIIVVIITLNVYSSSKKELKKLKSEQMEMAVLKEEFLSIKRMVDAVESKKALTKVEGVVQAVDEVFQPLGLKGKVKSVKPAGARETKDSIEEYADVQVEKVNMNEIVNVFYKVENVPLILSVKRAAIKTSFENPELFNLTITLSFVKPK